MVYVLSNTGKALMPTNHHGKVRHLLREGKARVVRREPFTIQLLYDSKKYTQPVTLGVDAGTGHVGLSATTESRELFAAEVTLRQDIQELLATRREARRSRRQRKTRYRAPRFDNRRRPDGWLAPSAEQAVQSHLALIRKVHAILPVTQTVIEVAQFDTQLLKNPDIAGTEYQQGEQLGFWNVREYVLFRDGHCCQHCHGKSGDKVLNVHHIESRKTGGDSPGNLITLCKTCHRAYHQGKIRLKVRRGALLRDAALMNVMRWTVYNRAKEEFGNVRLTYGYRTKNIRIKNGLEKSKTVDARCISGHPLAEPAETLWQMRQRRRHNRQLYKANTPKGGVRKKNQAPYIVKGFRIFDKVRYNGIGCFIFGRRSSGSFDIRLFDGTKVHAGVSYKKLKFEGISKSFIINQVKRNLAIPPTNEFVGFLANLS
ncbi:MAG: RNA-guided endonuclease IscB [Candidatus Cryptobacteroides sp.]